jgi:hypothetical protein
MVSSDRVHELTAELTTARSNLQTAELRAATGLEQLAKQKKMMQEQAAQLQAEKDRQVRAARIVQLLAKKSGHNARVCMRMTQHGHACALRLNRSRVVFVL